MSSAQIQVNSEWLKWARKSAYYNLEEISEKMKVAKGTVEKWETTGTLKYNHLLKLAEFYQRPPMMFFNENNPEKFKFIIPDYRTKNSENQDEITPLISFELRSARDRRENLLLLEEESDEYEIPIFKFNLSDGATKYPETLAKDIKELVGMTKTEMHVHKGQKGLNFWIKKVEDLGILIFQFYGIKPEEMRGYALTYDKLPIIGINHQDHPNGKKFTLFHELAHVLIKKEGISSFNKYFLPNSKEIFCNAVAAETLVPTTYLLDKINLIGNNGNWTDGKIKNLVNYFNVSQEVIVRRLLTLKIVTPDYYHKKKEEWDKFIPHGNSKSNDSKKIQTDNNIGEKFKSKGKKEDEKEDYIKKINTRKAAMAIKRNGIYYTEMVLSAYDAQLITNSTMAGYLGETLQVIGEIRKKLPAEMVE